MDKSDGLLPEEPGSGVRVHASLAPKLNLASYQNAVPFVREVRIVNGTYSALRGVELTVSSEPAFLRPRTWRIDEVRVGQTYHVGDLDVGLNGGLLAGLTEAETAEAVFVLTQNGDEVAKLEQPIELLARNQWGGIELMPDLVAAFVQPNDPAVDHILKKAAEILRQHGKSAALDGYAGGPRRVWEVVSALWASVGSLGLDYSLPPASFERTGQKVRAPSQIVDGGLATCLDTALLFCAVLEQCGLNSLIAFAREHAFAGVWLRDEQFSTVVTDDITSLRKRLKINELVLFETTLATQRPCPGFGHAVESGAHRVSEAEEHQFELAVDVSRARLQRIKPLAGEAGADAAVAEEPRTDLESVFEEAPDLPDDAIARRDAEAAPAPTTRLERWQRKLLDLSLRNRLLNFRATKRAIRFEAPEPGRLEDLLADGQKLRLLPRPDLMDGKDERSQTIYEGRTREDLRRSHAIDALRRKEVFVDLDEDDLNGRLVELYRAARASLQEGGANTLYLALGFLLWTRDAKEETRYRAPLILIPVSLQRKSVRSGFRLHLHDDEPRFNPTLLEMLRQDFNLSMAVADGELPKDESGLDIDGIWRAVSEAIKDIRGWDVAEDVVLSTFSFAKYLMWKDLAERTEVLKENRVVRHLIDTPHDPYPTDLLFPDPRALDASQSPEQSFCPLPADSSQLSAIMAAAKGKDFVLVGPPGTGKSQTIANLIAQCLAEKKTVLFVSEKIAALDVVYRRLRDVGLGEFCLELHSNKARKLDVIEQLRRSWETKGSVDADTWRREAKRIKALRDDLNRFVVRLHNRYRNGLTPYAAIGQVVANRDAPDVGLSWPSTDAHDLDGLDALRELADRLDINAREVGDIVGSPLALIAHSEWSAGWQQSVISAARDLIPAAKAIEAAAEAYRQAIGIPDVSLDRRGLGALAGLAGALPQAAGRDWRFALRPDIRSLGEDMRRGLDLLDRHREAKSRLSVPYRDEALRLDLDQLQATCAEAEGAWFLRTWLLRRRVRITLVRVAERRAKVDVDRDVGLLIELRDLEREIAGLDELAARTGGIWAGLNTRLGEAQAALEFRTSLSAAVAGLAATPEELSEVKAAFERLLGDGNTLLEPPGPIAGAGNDFVDTLEQYSRAVEALASLAGAQPEALQEIVGRTPSALSETCIGLIQLEPKLNAWCAWRKVRADAIRHGLAPLVGAVESGGVAVGTVAAAFETAYCRWWINGVVDGDDILRTFVSAEHEKRIADFRELDDRFTALTRDYLRASLCAGLPDQSDVSRGSEWGILKREMEKKRRHKPLRELIESMPSALSTLSPCLLMSPLSIAQYLSPGTAPFDVVVFDEASQIPVWDAVGAIARGRQAVIVGDPKQLPPTSFFDRGEHELDTEEDVEGDLESILDECLGANLPTMKLTWHYRSRHESLIAFSNHRYYGGGLVTFPSPVTEDRAVTLRLVDDGVYEKGGARINKPEARVLVSDLVERLEAPDFNALGLSAGVVTFNAEQQRLIEDLLDEERSRNPSIEAHFAEDALEPVFVKNLESVQGDERDLMYFSTTYGPDISGTLSMNFGPLNRDGGERRLNVAVTRARHELHVFSSLRSEQIDLSRTPALGVRDLKHFLEFADRGPRALAEAISGSIGDFESPFEAAVAEALVGKGWQVHPQIGVSAFRIDLGVVDPDAPGRYLAGVECDGATYHRCATARDRDKLREQVLRGLGWEIVRIWSTDWWHDLTGSLEKVHGRLSVLLEDSRLRRARDEKERPADVRARASAAVSGQDAADLADPLPIAPTTTGPSLRHADDLFDDEDVPAPRRAYARSAAASDDTEVAGGQGVFREANPGTAVTNADPDAFFEARYDRVLGSMIAHVVEIEGPVRDDVLAKRIARAHGWGRTGSRIRDRVVALARKRFETTREDVGLFFWPSSADAATWSRFRRPVGDHIRAIDEIALPELTALAREIRSEGLDSDEAVGAMARRAGVRKLRKASRNRLQIAWNAVG